ncbi:calmodulin [Cyclospora cayetanensis]|uniref:Calmodulin n=1 Tax=Cyclospora cayetanensis TaxID=88456 RepID=A0A6P6RXK6_9EIME|nr:calmodulin [Cyclospora cayetanensis]
MASGKGVKLSEQHLRLIYDTFKLLDEDKDGMIDKAQFFTLFRALGQTTSNANLTKIFALAVAEESKKAATAAKEDQAAAKKTAPTVAATKKAAPVPAGERVSFSEFVKTFSDNYQKPVTETVLINAFNVFDPSHSGKLTLTQLHDILTKRGEPLPKTEVDELMLIAALGSAKQADYALLAKR